MAALLAARRGDAGPARATEAELSRLAGRWRFGEQTVWRARIAAVLGEEEHSLRLLRQALAEGQGAQLLYHLHVLRDFDALRARRAFRALYQE